MNNWQQDKEFTHLLHSKLNWGKKSAYPIAPALFSNSVQLQVDVDVGLSLGDDCQQLAINCPISLVARIRVYPFGVRTVMHESVDSIPFPGKGLFQMRKVPIKRCQDQTSDWLEKTISVNDSGAIHLTGSSKSVNNSFFKSLFLLLPDFVSCNCRRGRVYAKNPNQPLWQLRQWLEEFKLEILTPNNSSSHFHSAMN